MIKYFVLFSFTILIISCSKVDKNNGDYADEEDNDTISLSSEEIFSTTLVEDILEAGEDEDLKIYLEEEIYPIVSNSQKVTLDRVSASLYLLMYEDNGVVKKFIIQKFYNPSNFEIFFLKRETETSAIEQYLK